MLDSNFHIINAIETIAEALGELNKMSVYVGGAVVGLYVDNRGASEIRPTKDIDVVFKIASMVKLEELRQTLAKRNIYFAANENILCRFRYKNILLDVMSTQEIGWAPANPWFNAGFDKAETHLIGKVKIKILPVEYFLASKFSAYRNRGGDPRISSDFEDIVYILDNRRNIVKDISHSEINVRTFLKEEFKLMLKDSLHQEAILGHLEPTNQTERYKSLIDKLKKIVNSTD